MIPTLELLGMAFLLGFIFNATPGAVFAETIRHGMTGGYRAALSVQFGSLVGDARLNLTFRDAPGVDAADYATFKR